MLSVTITSCLKAPCEIPIDATVQVDIKFDHNANSRASKRNLPIHNSIGFYLQFMFHSPPYSIDHLKDAVKHEAFFVLNAVQLPAVVLENDEFYCNRTPIMRASLQVGDMITNVRLWMWANSFVFENYF